MTDLRQAAVQAEPCIGKDPRCPCQDGDACHYKDCGSTKALPVPVPEQEPVLLQCTTCGTVYADGVPPQVPEQEPDRRALQAEGKHPAPCARHCEAKAFEIEIRSLKSMLYTTPPQRPWVGLTDYEIAALDWQHATVDAECVRAIETLLKERNT